MIENGQSSRRGWVISVYYFVPLGDRASLVTRRLYKFHPAPGPARRDPFNGHANQAWYAMGSNFGIIAFPDLLTRSDNRVVRIG